MTWLHILKNPLRMCSSFVICHFMVFTCHMRNSVTYPILRCMLGILIMNNFTTSVTWWQFTLKCSCQYLGVSMFNSIMRCIPMLHNGQQVNYIVHNWHMALACSRFSSSCIVKWEQITLAINMLNNIFPLHTKTQNYHLNYHDVPLYMS